jgi:hypothetical protein
MEDEDTRNVFDNLFDVQVRFLSFRCRGERTVPTVATDHQSVKREGKAVTPTSPANPAQHSWVGVDRRTHA